MTVEHAAGTGRLVARAAVVLADLDGCLASGNIPLPGAVALAEWLGPRLWLVSNNSTEVATELSAVLAKGGLRIPPARIVLAGEAAVAAIAHDHPGASLLLAGSTALRRAASDAGLRVLDWRGNRTPDVVLLARDRNFSYGRLQRIAVALRNGATLVATNPDLTHPGPNGRPIPETGALLAAVMATAPSHPVRIVGKPQPELFHAALTRAGVTDPARAVMIGDNPATDIAGARTAGIPAILLGPSPHADIPDIRALLPSFGATP